MAWYFVRRIAQALATVFCVVLVAFFLGRLSGSPAALLLTDGASAQQITDLNSALGFDKPLLAQLGDFIAGVFQGDLGSSYRDQSKSALSIILGKLPSTISLAVISFIVGLGVAVLVAVGLRAGGANTAWMRHGLIVGGSVRHSVPDFFFGVLAVLVFSVFLGWLPSLGNTGPSSYVLPVLTIASGQFVLYLRLLDNALSEQENQDYVRTALARGKSRLGVVAGEMLPNALLPVMTVASLNLAALLGGTVIVEQVFSWPGVGAVLIDAVSQRDFPIVQAGLLVVAAIFVTVNFVVDVAYWAIDPRVRLR